MLGQTVSMSEISAPGQEKGAISVSGWGGARYEHCPYGGLCDFPGVLCAYLLSHHYGRNGALLSMIYIILCCRDFQNKAAVHTEALLDTVAAVIPMCTICAPKKRGYPIG
jgi:hypothetical protein